MVDPDLLRTLPQAELQAGWGRGAEDRAHRRRASCGDGSPRIEPVDERTILACARTKLAVVAEDERDGGRRQVLNLGHTVGHAIETATGYARYRHGEAVGLGLLAALRLSGQEALREQVRELLLAHGLPVKLEGAAVDEVVAMTARDKKRLGTRVPFVLVDAPGDVRIGCEVAARRAARGRGRVGLMAASTASGVARGQPEHAGSARSRALRHAHAGAVGAAHLDYAAELDLEVRFLQTNAEGEFVEHLHGLPDLADGIVSNPGAWTHYSWAIRDALEIAALPAVEVHLSDVKAREPWRRVSVVRICAWPA